MASAQSEITRYSEVIEGSVDNHDKPVRFDLTRGCLGITEYTVDKGVTGRILLSRKQARRLVKFLKFEDHQ